MIKVTDLVKDYGKKKAVKGISFSIGEGEVVGFLGPNGAGKSTVMNILTGYLPQTSGSVAINGLDMTKNPAKAKPMIGYLPEHPPLYGDMTVGEYLDFCYSIQAARQPKKAHLDELREFTGIADVNKRLIRNLSKGYKQRVGLAQALIGDPPVLILDEPTVGLDPNQIHEIRELLGKLGKNRTVLISSHILPEIQLLCRRVLVINEGVLVADNTPEKLSESLTNSAALRVQTAGEEKAITALLSGVDGVRDVLCRGESEEGTLEFLVSARENRDLRAAISRALAAQDLPVLGIARERASLESVFMQLTLKETDHAKGGE